MEDLASLKDQLAAKKLGGRETGKKSTGSRNKGNQILAPEKKKATLKADS